jgi:hypothetical protein
MARLNVRAPEELFPQLQQRNDNLSEAIRESLMRYFALMTSGRRQLQGVFTGNEIALIVDVTNGTLFDAVWMESGGELMSFEVLDSKPDGTWEKWEVDGNTLAEKLKSLNNLQAAALIDAIQRFWNRRDEQMEIAGGMKGWESILE